MSEDFYASYKNYDFSYSYIQDFLTSKRIPHIEMNFADNSGWFQKVRFSSKEDWFKFVREVNNCNKLIKKWKLKEG